MPERWVVNASPLIRLAKVEHLHLLSVLLRARQAGLITATVPLLLALRKQGYRLDDVVIRRTLMAVTGETWE